FADSRDLPASLSLASAKGIRPAACAPAANRAMLRNRFQVPARDIGRRQAGARMADFDLAIIGGGINGAGIARDAAGRGIRVLLLEQNDLASATSSASTKLIHGGLRYLEQG